MSETFNKGDLVTIVESGKNHPMDGRTMHLLYGVPDGHGSPDWLDGGLDGALAEVIKQDRHGNQPVAIIKVVQVLPVNSEHSKNLGRYLVFSLPGLAKKKRLK